MWTLTVFIACAFIPSHTALEIVLYTEIGYKYNPVCNSNPCESGSYTTAVMQCALISNLTLSNTCPVINLENTPDTACIHCDCSDPSTNDLCCPTSAGGPGCLCPLRAPTASFTQIPSRTATAGSDYTAPLHCTSVSELQTYTAPCSGSGGIVSGECSPDGFPNTLGTAVLPGFGALTQMRSLEATNTGFCIGGMECGGEGSCPDCPIVSFGTEGQGEGTSAMCDSQCAEAGLDRPGYTYDAILQTISNFWMGLLYCIGVTFVPWCGGGICTESILTAWPYSPDEAPPLQCRGFVVTNLAPFPTDSFISDWRSVSPDVPGLFGIFSNVQFTVINSVTLNMLQTQPGFQSSMSPRHTSIRLGDTFYIARSPDVYCHSMYLTDGNVTAGHAGRGSFYFQIIPNPFSVTCQDCMTCVCDNFGERGIGNQCCPDFFLTSEAQLNGTLLGPNCTFNARACSAFGLINVCAGNGNPLFSSPGVINVGSTGCMYNPTSNSSNIYCACLPEYLPPAFSALNCVSRTTDTIGSPSYDANSHTPYCSGHGQPTYINARRPQLGVICICDNGFVGTQCQFPISQCFIDINSPPCGSISAGSQGVCLCQFSSVTSLLTTSSCTDASGFGGTSCLCEPGWSGALCETSMESCTEVSTASVCANRGVCEHSPGCLIGFPAVRPTLPFVPTCSFCPERAPPFYVMAAATALTNTGASVFAGGSVSVSPGNTATGFDTNVTGTQIIGGSLHVNDSGSIVLPNGPQITAFLATLLSCSSCGAITVSGFQIGGRTFTPGTYTFPTFAVVSTGTTVILDSGNNTNSAFRFLVGSSLTIETGGSVVLVGAGQASQIFWVVGSNQSVGVTAVFGVRSQFTGNLISYGGVTADAGTIIEGFVFSLMSSIVTNRVQFAIAPVPSQDGPCTALGTSFDLCNSTTSNTTFCTFRVGVPFNLKMTDADFAFQTFTLPELDCLMTQQTIIRGFAIMNWQRTFCITELAASTQYFPVVFGGPASGPDAALWVGPCPSEIAGPQRYDIALRLYQIPDPTHPWIINQVCYILDQASFLANSSLRAIPAIGVRVGNTVSANPPRLDPRAALLDSCLVYLRMLSSAQRFFGIDSVCNRCLYPSSISYLTNFGYNAWNYLTDIYDPASNYFMVSDSSAF